MHAYSQKILLFTRQGLKNLDIPVPISQISSPFKHNLAIKDGLPKKVISFLVGIWVKKISIGGCIFKTSVLKRI
ncbi:MAG: hypothetical protein A2527_13295 [Candidatus Lambdaproteobacteria bacterium RIFOXYD2_FULL_50_16]|uniref:Uncharacterized protein n=1 Tax=Candidatus Lambdaproteobacteria bacterium RIFOXYD2_FULL_50_16 TaxID=1817772 RepID=A0A1F6G534_9PROT|nr:MAG: hypothetical protein A2527_13295 [Candidatus Lambdaproteobacteria bacterium RIFOXYD2_FULL_50_16]